MAVRFLAHLLLQMDYLLLYIYLYDVHCVVKFARVWTNFCVVPFGFCRIAEMLRALWY